MKIRVDVQIACEGVGVPDAEWISLWVGRALQAVAHANYSDVSVRVVGRDEARRLNREFRQIDKATNVLSFPAGAVDGLPVVAGTPLGDVVVCAPLAQQESANLGKEEGGHWAHLLVHGTLHLLGFDHESENQAIEMETLESEILTSNGIEDPYKSASETDLIH